MPGFDRTGPQGFGPASGGGRGLCSGGPAPSDRGQQLGGMKRGRGAGNTLLNQWCRRGGQNRFQAGVESSPQLQNEVQELKSKLDQLQRTLSSLKGHISRPDQQS